MHFWLQKDSVTRAIMNTREKIVLFFFLHSLGTLAAVVKNRLCNVYHSILVTTTTRCSNDCPCLHSSFLSVWIIRYIFFPLSDTVPGWLLAMLICIWSRASLLFTTTRIWSSHTLPSRLTVTKWRNYGFGSDNSISNREEMWAFPTQVMDQQEKYRRYGRSILSWSFIKNWQILGFFEGSGWLLHWVLRLFGPRRILEDEAGRECEWMGHFDCQIGDETQGKVEVKSPSFEGKR